MLIEFSVENFLSFYERVTLSLRAAPEVDRADGLLVNTFNAPGGLRLLKTTLVFGANASGKSNLVKALVFARKLVLDSARETQAGEPIGVTPFRLDPTAASRPSSFELIWIDAGTRYRYAFSVDTEKIIAETLTRMPHGTEAELALFVRDTSGIRIGEAFAEGRDLETKTRSNALFLSVVAQFNGEEAQRVVGWFRARLTLASGLQDQAMLRATLKKVITEESTQDILRFVREADLGIVNISTAKVKLPSGLPEDLRKALLDISSPDEIQLLHNVVDAEGLPGEPVRFDFRAESDGTQKLVALAGPLIDVLQTSAALFLDELDARLHPRLTRAIVRLFQDTTNPGNGQLVAMTHDTNLLDRRLLRRDQIWFTEKDRRGATKLYSLAEFDLPSEAKYERDYLLGKYGAVPAVGDLMTSGSST